MSDKVPPSQYVTKFYMEVQFNSKDKGAVCLMNIPAGTPCKQDPNSDDLFLVLPMWDGATEEEKDMLFHNPFAIHKDAVATKIMKRSDDRL